MLFYHKYTHYHSNIRGQWDFFLMNTFIQEGHIELIKSNSKYI